MLTVEKLDNTRKAHVRRFVSLPFRLYRNNPHWVPPVLLDQELQLNRAKYPFFEHSDADFFIAVRDGQDVGRIAVMENRPFNSYHATRQAHFTSLRVKTTSKLPTPYSIVLSNGRSVANWTQSLVRRGWKSWTAWESCVMVSTSLV